MKQSLHWSFDYFDDARRPPRTSALHPGQVRVFLGLLRTYYKNAYPVVIKESAESTLRYSIVSNWRPGCPLGSPWNSGGKPGIRAGEATISRKSAADHTLRFAVTYENHTRGERGEARFVCGDDPLRSLKDSWHLAVRNTADGDYRSYESWGRAVESDPDRLLLEVSYDRKAYIAIGTVPAATGCTSSWALLEGLPTLAATGWPQTNDSFAFLDDLEKLKPHNMLGYLGKFSQSTGGASVDLEGYYVHGTGTIPTYYWLDDHGHVVIATNLYLTYVLQDVVAA